MSVARMHLPDYIRIKELLARARSLADAAEAHGTLAGCLCGAAGYGFEDWLREILPEGRAEAGAGAALVRGAGGGASPGGAVRSAAALRGAGAMTREEFARRRRQLMRLMGRDSIAVLPAAPVRQRNNDVEYPYRQDSDFHYLTGFGEPEAVAVLVPGRPQAEYILFVRERDRVREIWDGRRAGPAGAARDYGADDAFPIGDID